MILRLCVPTFLTSLIKVVGVPAPMDACGSGAEAMANVRKSSGSRPPGGRLADGWRTVSGHCQFEVRQTSTSRAVGGRFPDVSRRNQSPVGEISCLVTTTYNEPQNLTDRRSFWPPGVRKTSTYRPRSGRLPDLKLAMSGNRPPIVRQPSTWWTTSGRLPGDFRTLAYCFGAGPTCIHRRRNTTHTQKKEAHVSSGERGA